MDSTLTYRGLGLPWQVEDALDKLIADAKNKDTLIANLQSQIASLPAPLTLQQISQGLSAGGAAPLNLTGLPGK